jgi:hypothetical protein
MHLLSGETKKRDPKAPFSFGDLRDQALRLCSIIFSIMGVRISSMA